MVFKNLSVLVLWTKVASVLEGLRVGGISQCPKWYQFLLFSGGIGQVSSAVVRAVTRWLQDSQASELFQMREWTSNQLIASMYTSINFFLCWSQLDTPLAHDYMAACIITTCPVANCKCIRQKMTIAQAEHDLTWPARQAMFWAESSQCNSPLFNRVAGQVEVLAGQVNFRGSLPCLASNVLEPILHPVTVLLGQVNFRGSLPCLASNVLEPILHPVTVLLSSEFVLFNVLPAIVWIFVILSYTTLSLNRD